jgi:hypothetical protein
MLRALLNFFRKNKNEQPVEVTKPVVEPAPKPVTAKPAAIRATKTTKTQPKNKPGRPSKGSPVNVKKKK